MKLRYRGFSLNPSALHPESLPSLVSSLRQCHNLGLAAAGNPILSEGTLVISFDPGERVPEVLLSAVEQIFPEPSLEMMVPLWPFEVQATLQDIRADISSIKTDYRELKSAKERLEQLRLQGLFKFTEKIDPDSFRIFCAVIAHGDIAKASRALNRPDSGLRSHIARWRRRGPAYRALTEMVRWRKRLGRRSPVLLSEAILNPKSATADYPGLLSDTLDTLLEMDEYNWPDKVESLVALLRPFR
jgi:hypothetical protein